MYKIIKDGAVLAQTEAVNYVCLQDNGCYALCDERDALGIVHGGTVYHLLGRDALAGCDSVVLEQFDAGAELNATTLAVENADAMNVDQEYRLTLLELGILPDDSTDTTV